jgi:hypothetical protein
MKPVATLAELADANDSKSFALNGHPGSIPGSGTTLSRFGLLGFEFWRFDPFLL